MKLSEELEWRGFYKQATFESPDLLDKNTYTLYLGTDPSGDSLHVGHLAVYMLVRRFIDRGHKVVLLVGGGTGVVGDPGGKTEERTLLSLEEIARNSEALAGQVKNLFNDQEFTLVNNYDWLHKVSVLDFLRDVGKHFSVGQLVQRDFIASRIGEGGSGISYAEFSYTLLQGYDFWHLYKNYGVNLQIGGSDQWGNILSGVELLRKKEGVEVNGMTAPLVINKSTGKKFGKSEGGAVWLDAEKTSVYKFYQFWLNTDDESVIDYLKLFTLLSKEDVDIIERTHQQSPEQRTAQKALAMHVTDIVHGQNRRESVERVIEVLFGGQDISELSTDDLKELSKEIPTVATGTNLVEALVSSGVVGSNGEARRLLASGGISVNGQKVDSDVTLVQTALIKKGKNSFILVDVLR
jgi:tyrosyl-tRNA synthetase